MNNPPFERKPLISVGSERRKGHLVPSVLGNIVDLFVAFLVSENISDKINDESLRSSTSMRRQVSHILLR